MLQSHGGTIGFHDPDWDGQVQLVGVRPHITSNSH